MTSVRSLLNKSLSFLRSDEEGRLLVRHVDADGNPLGTGLPASLGAKPSAQSLSTTPATDAVFTVAPGQVAVLAAGIANGSSITNGLNLSNGRLARIGMPAAWTAANLTFAVSADNATFQPLYNADGSEYTVTAAAGRDIIIPLVDFLGARYLQIRSGTAAAPVVQTAARTLTLSLVP